MFSVLIILGVIHQDLLLAGTGTISVTVEWAMAELICHPDILKRAQRELDTVIGVDRLVEESDIPNLPYLQAVVKEAFRMHPAAPVSLPHRASQASNVMGFSLPADTRLILNIFAIHRDPSVYHNPDAFNPQRFVEHPEVNHTSAYHSYELMPFGAGRRMCPAFNIGNGLVLLLLAHLLHSFDWSLPPGHTLDEALDMSEASSSLTVSLKTPLRLVAHPRSPAFLY